MYTVEAKNNEIIMAGDNSFCTIRVLEENIVNVKISKQKKIGFPTYTVTPGDTELPFEGISRYNSTSFTNPEYLFEEESDAVNIETKRLKLTLSKSDLKINWKEKNNDKVNNLFSDRSTQSYKEHISENHPIVHYISRDLEDMYFGLGEKSGPMNKHGQRYRMKNIDAMGYDAAYTDPLYKHIPFYITHNPVNKTSYGLFYDDYNESIFDLGKELDNYHGYYRYYETKNDYLDYYVIVGDDVKEVSQTFSWLTGRPALMPEWSFSYSGSTMQYTDAPNSTELLNGFLDQCHKYGINVRSFHLSSGYTSIDNKRYTFNWNYDKFPNPKEFGEYFVKNGVELVANIKPSLMMGHPLLNEVLKFNGFIKDVNGKPLEIQFWDDTGYYLDFTNPQTIRWWQKQLKEKLFSNNINCTWNDNNEFEVWDDKAQVYGFGTEYTDFKDYRAIMSLFMIKASREAQKEYFSIENPYLISRSGFAGMSKYVQTWSGDNNTSWKSLKYNNVMAKGMSISGIHNFGHDIGGFSGPKPTPELFLRWVQNGVFYPRFSIHSWNDDGSVNEPWMYEEIRDEVVKMMHLHERLVPYFNELQNESYKNFEAIIRPTFYDFPEDVYTYKENDEFMLGDKMLVAPIVEEKQKQRIIYLPDNGKGWVGFFDGKEYNKGESIVIDVTSTTIPVFIQKGETIPMYDDHLKDIIKFLF